MDKIVKKSYIRMLGKFYFVYRLFLELHLNRHVFLFLDVSEKCTTWLCFIDVVPSNEICQLNWKPRSK